MKKTLIGLSLIISGSIALLFTFGFICSMIYGNLTDGIVVHPDGRDLAIEIASVATFYSLLKLRHELNRRVRAL